MTLPQGAYLSIVLQILLGFVAFVSGRRGKNSKLGERPPPPQEKKERGRVEK